MSFTSVINNLWNQYAGSWNQVITTNQISPQHLGALAQQQAGYGPVSGTLTGTLMAGYPGYTDVTQQYQFKTSGLNMASVYPLLDKEEKDLIVLTVKHYTTHPDYQEGRFHAGRLPFALRDECLFCLFIAQHFNMKLYQKLEVEDFKSVDTRQVILFTYKDGKEAELTKYRLHSGFGAIGVGGGGGSGGPSTP